MSTLSSMNIIDVIVLFIFFFSVLIGFGRGFVGEVVSLLTLIAAFAVAIMFANPLATAFTRSSSVQSAVIESTSAIGTSTAQSVSFVAIGLCFGLLFVGTILAGAIVRKILNIAFNTGILGFGNRILGAFFGLARGALINLVLIFLLGLSPVADKPTWRNSYFVQTYEPAVVWLGRIVSPAMINLKNKFDSTIEQVGVSIQNMTNGM